MAEKKQKPATTPQTGTGSSSTPIVAAPTSNAPSASNAEQQAALPRLNDLNSQRPGSAASRKPLPDLKKLQAMGYRAYPIDSMDVLNSAAKDKPDAALPRQKVGAGGYDAVANGTFTFDTPGHYHENPAGAVMRDGKLDTPGVDKAKNRGGVAVLDDGSIVVGRQNGNKAQDIQDSFGTADARVEDFAGGGALLIENGKAVTSKDLLEKQKFDQGGGGINAQQMRQTAHSLVGIRDGQAFLLMANNKTGAQIQRDLLGFGFDSVVKFDGGSGAYLRDTQSNPYQGTDAIGLGVKTRKR